MTLGRLKTLPSTEPPLVNEKPLWILFQHDAP